MRTTQPAAMRLGLFVATMLASAGAASADDATSLRWKFKAGEKLSYNREEKMISKITAMGMDVESTSVMGVEITWTIKRVDENGGAELTAKIDRFRHKVESAFGGIAYDSKDDKEPEGEFAAVIGPIITGFAGAEFTLKTDAQGVAKDVKIPDKLIGMLQGNPLAGQFGPAYSVDGLKSYVELGIPVSKAPVSKGQSWPKKEEFKAPFGTIKRASTFTYQGPDSRNGSKVEKIDVKRELSVEATPTSMFGVKVKGQESKGTVYFDNSAGRFVEVELKEKATMEIDLMGNVLEQSTEQTTTIKLAKGE